MTAPVTTEPTPPPAVGAWQDIATAPKDGTAILVYDASWCGGKPRVASTHWVGYRTKANTDLPWEEKGSFLGVSKPSHWQPLHAAPDSAPKGGA